MGCVLTSNGALKFFVVKKQLLDDYEDKIEEVGYFGEDFQNI
jgi:hypothetical protein